MYKVVLDPVVMLRGLLNPHSLCGPLFFDYADRYRAVFSDETVRATRVLLAHPIFLLAFPRLAKISPTRLSQVFLAAERVPIEPEPDVSVFVTTARVAQADYLICEDKLLWLTQGSFGVPAIRCQAFLSLLDPDRFFSPAEERIES